MNTDMNVPIEELMRIYNRHERELSYARDYSKKYYEKNKEEIRERNRERYRRKRGIEAEESKRGRPLGSYKTN